jgi:hypothetical protein
MAARSDRLPGVRAERQGFVGVTSGFEALLWMRHGERLPALQRVVLLHNQGAAT